MVSAARGMLSPGVFRVRTARYRHKSTPGRTISIMKSAIELMKTAVHFADIDAGCQLSVGRNPGYLRYRTRLKQRTEMPTMLPHRMAL